LARGFSKEEFDPHWHGIRAGMALKILPNWQAAEGPVHRCRTKKLALSETVERLG